MTIEPPAINVVRLALAAARTRDPVLWCWLQVAVATGARRGEVCALRWCDVELAERTVRIERSVSESTGFGVVVKSTKTGKSRVVSLTAQAADALADRRSNAARAAEAAGRELAPAELVFATDPLGRRPWRPSLVTRRWRLMCEEAGLGHVRIHDLRQFTATELLSAGIDVRTVSNRLGHARTSTTLDIYWGFVPARDREAADHLDALLDPVPKPERDALG